MDATLVDTSGWDIPIGTAVYDVTGDKLGTVRGADPYTLRVGHGLFIITEYAIDLGAVDRYEDGKLFVTLTRAQVIGQSA